MEIRLNKYSGKNNRNVDTHVKMGLSQTQHDLPYDELVETINLNDRFSYERNQSNTYKLIFNIDLLATNVLFNLTDVKNYNNYTLFGFNNYINDVPDKKIFLDNSYPYDGDVNDNGDLTFPDSITNNLIEKNGVFGFFEPDKTKKNLCSFYEMTPNMGNYEINNDNWNILLTYPKKVDKTHILVNNGLLLIEKIDVNINGSDKTILGTHSKHNLSIGDTIVLKGTNKDGNYIVSGLGLENGDYQDYYFIIDLNGLNNINQNSRFSKMINNVESTYYFRIFEKIIINNIEIFDMGFSVNYFNNVIKEIIFDTVNLENLTDNLDRPLSEIYLSIVKKQNDMFSFVSSGIETPSLDVLNTSNTNTYLRNVPAINKIHNGGLLPFPTHIPLESKIKDSDNYFYGDIVEYNETTLTETVLSVISHRFNSVNREEQNQVNYVSKLKMGVNEEPEKTIIDLGPRQEGYFYQPHNKIDLRFFSTYIEEGNPATDEIPSYALKINDNKYIWRDFLPIGLTTDENVDNDYPFLNGSHYINKNIVFNIRRQDPFGFWGLYYNKFPSDPIGDRLDVKNLVIKSSNYGC